MSRKCEKGCNNPFYMARMRAVNGNERLASRFCACEMIATSEKRLGLIENGLTNPYPEEVLMMSKVYNAPELENYYCSTVCPLRAVPAIESEKSLSEMAITAYHSLRYAKELQEEIMDIVADGKISDDEVPRIEKIIEILDGMSRVKEELSARLRKYS